MDRGEQQDPQEFSKLFVGRIESLNVSSRDPSYASLSSLLQGSLTYRVTCSECRCTPTPRVSAFLELDVNIDGQSTLKEALASIFKDELLEGENMYECSRCGGKRNAVRSTTLKSLPSVLSLQLLRYVYDRASGQKKKLKTPISFPASLSLSDSSSSKSSNYRLVSVLYHKGGSAYGGHYVSEVFQSNKQLLE